MAAGYTAERGKVDMGEEGLGLRSSGVTLTHVTHRHCRPHDQSYAVGAVMVSRDEPAAARVDLNQRSCA
jgi:hypothetical protein